MALGIDEPGRRPRNGLPPAGGHDLSHGVRTRLERNKRIAALVVSRRGGLAVIELAIAIRIQVDRPAGQAQFAVVPMAVAVEVVELRAADLGGRQASIAKVDTFDDGASGAPDPM